MSVIHVPSKPEISVRLLVFPVVLAAALLVIFLRLWYFQVVLAAELSDRAEATRSKSVPLSAPRGSIVDRNGVLIAGVRSEITITIKPGVLKKDPWVLDNVAAILHADPKKLARKINAAQWPGSLPLPIFTGATIEQGTQIAESGEDLPGVGVSSEPVRYYPDTVSFSHLLGYVGIPNQKEIERVQKAGLEPSQIVGKSGLEKAFETDLMGDAGAERVEVDAKGRPLRVLGRDNPTPGNRLTATIDAKLQQMAHGLMEHEHLVGGIAAVDPRNGEVLCLVSNPSFDLKMFEGGISADDWAELQSDKDYPLLNRAISSAYAPGSTFKIVTSLAAWENKDFDTRWSVFCNGGYQLGNRFFKCLGHHGRVSFDRALQVSCNTYFYTLGHRVGGDGLRKAALDVGLNERTGIEIAGESSGLIPTDDWIAKHRKPAQWYQGDTLNMAIGQGETRATPLQMANLMALVANDGVSYVPHLVRSVRSPAGRVEKVVPAHQLHHVPASAHFWSTLKNALVGVIEGGTARSAQIPGLRWGGKTGSAEHGKAKRTHSWFVGFAPADDPKIAICVLAESAGHGGEISAPIARQIVQRYLAESSANPKSRAAASALDASAESPADR